MAHRKPFVLSIAGSDPSGGAGIQADIKTCSFLGCEAGAAITALTAQNASGVKKTFALPPQAVRAQLDALAEDVPPAAVKTGMLYNAETVKAVLPFLSLCARENVPVICDPVCVSSSGYSLLDKDGLDILARAALPLCEAVTPNLSEAALLYRVITGKNPEDADKEAYAAALISAGARAVIITGGHEEGASAYITDMLFSENSCVSYRAKRIPGGENARGTGCAFSAAFACFRARGLAPEEAAARAGSSVRRMIADARPEHNGRPLLGFAAVEPA